MQRSISELRGLAGRIQNAREEERKRIAREIHDQLGQALTAIKIDLSKLKSDLPAERKELLDASESIVRMVDQAIQSARKIATELRPGILDDFGLMAAVESEGEEFERRTGIECQLHLPDPPPKVDPERATATFRILQEALSNVVRHANATRVVVRLTYQAGNLMMEVEDNGDGITQDEASASESFGILGMKERALLLGGDLSIRGIPGKGTTVRVWSPLVAAVAQKG